MGYIVPPPDHATFAGLAVLKDLEGYYRMGSAFLAYGTPRMVVTRPIEYADRTWADLHLEALGYGLLGSLGLLALLVAWFVQ